MFELVVVVNFFIIEVMCLPGRYAVAGTLPYVFAGLAPLLIGQLTGGVLIRLAIAAVRGTARQYLASIRTAGWITDTLRLLFFGLLTAQRLLMDQTDRPVFSSGVVRPAVVEPRPRAAVRDLADGVTAQSLFCSHRSEVL